MPPIKSGKTGDVPTFTHAVRSVWLARTVKVATDEGWRDVQAKVCEGVAVHPATDRRKSGRWSVTAIGTGLRFCELPSEGEALRVGEVVLDHASAAMRRREQTQALADLPPWFIAWARSCAQAGRCVDVKQFVRKEGA